MTKKRLDVVLVEKKLVASRSLAQRLVMAGNVRVNGQVMIKPSTMILEKDELALIDEPRFVSRGGEKLDAALQKFGLLDLSGYICVDVGASTGGFTDCLLQHGAQKVYALDVGYGVLHWKLRRDKRVEVMERTNARYVQGFEEQIDLVSIDASFISLRIILPVVKNWMLNEKHPEVDGNNRRPFVIALIKPQFEAGKADAAKGEGVIRDHQIHRQVLLDVLNYAAGLGFHVAGLIRSPLTGPKGNIEFLTKLDFYHTGSVHEIDLSEKQELEILIEQVLENEGN